ncbi:MAG: nucleoside-diphosphate sugar epimerase/dehydratase [Actinomycetota bacterium]
MTLLASMLRPVLAWVYGRPRAFPIAVDVVAWVVGLVIAAVLSPGSSIESAGLALSLTALLAVVFHGGLGYLLGLYRRRWRVSSFDEVAMLGIVWLGTALLVIAVTFVSHRAGSPLPTSAVVTGALVTVVGQGFVRAVWRRFWEQSHRPASEECHRTIVFGAGEMGTYIIRAMLLDTASEYLPVALLDDQLGLRNRRIDGVRVMGGRDDLRRVAAQTRGEVLLIAVHQPPPQLLKELTTVAAEIGLRVLVLPNTSELVGRLTLADIRPPTVEALLGRDPVEIDLAAVAGYVTGRRVLVTGAGGSIGSELSQQIRDFGPSELYLLDRDETALHSLQLAMEGRALLDSDMLVVADIRDRERMFELFERLRPEVVFHTAALKHLTLLEHHPTEGMKTNTVGTKNVLDAARSVGVDRFVNISTDKAADPTSVLGATKQAAERLTAAAARDTGRPYVSVRFGNVLGSRGSVLPTFLGQIEQGEPITVTHPEVTRYFMTIPEAVRLVVQAGAIGDPGEVLILDMGAPVKIVDLANQLINSLAPGTKIEFTGLRQGEKLHEVLISEQEVGNAKRHPRITHTVCDGGPAAEALAAIGPDAVAEVRRLLDAADLATVIELSVGHGNDRH